MDEIIVIRAADPDGSLFQAIMDVLKDKRAEVIHAAASVSSVLRIGELEIHHGHRRVFVAGREVRLNHGEYAMLYCMASAPGRYFPRRSSMQRLGERSICMGLHLWRISSGD